MAIPVKYIDTSGAPREIPASAFNNYQPFDTSTSIRINNFAWLNTPIKAGVTFLTSQGQRFVLEANAGRVVYVVINPTSSDHNKTFIQAPKGFIGDVVSYPFEDAGRKMRPIVAIAEFEVQMIIGILSTTGWMAFALVVGVDVLSFSVQNKDNFKKWSEITKACLSTRKDLKKYAPTLYDKLVYSALLMAWEGTVYAGGKKGEISDTLAERALTDPNVAGRGVGIIVGKLGSSALNGRIGILSAVWTLLFTAATKMASVAPGALAAKVQDIKSSGIDEKADLTNQLLTVVRNSDIKVTQEEAKKIAEEVANHPNELKKSLTNLYDVFQKNSK